MPDAAVIEGIRRKFVACAPPWTNDRDDIGPPWKRPNRVGEGFPQCLWRRDSPEQQLLRGSGNSKIAERIRWRKPLRESVVRVRDFRSCLRIVGEAKIYWIRQEPRKDRNLLSSVGGGNLDWRTLWKPQAKDRNKTEMPASAVL